MSPKSSTSIICSGYSRLPEGMTAKEVYGVFGLGLEIETRTGEIIDAVSTLVTPMGNEFLSSVLIGHNILKHGLDAPIAQIENRYFGAGKKAIIAAIRDANERFEEFKRHPVKIGPSSLIESDETDSIEAADTTGDGKTGVGMVTPES